MKNKLMYGVLLFMISCKPSSLDFGIAGKYSNYGSYHELDLCNDNSFTYIMHAGCWEFTYQGAWSYAQNHKILLAFPNTAGDDIFIAALYPLSAGKNVYIHITEDGLINIDSLARNTYLAKVDK
jgi:hypothetical protein